ncbi:MAG: hypothetical protein GY851_09200 [bacterium]|nr:hypothetical protein [bacterium]
MPTYNVGSPLLGSDDDAVKFNADGYYADAGTTNGNIATDDLVARMVVKTPANTSVLFGKREGGVGWEVSWTAGTHKFVFYLVDASGGTTVASAALADNTWYTASLWANRDGSAQWYVNGAASGAAVDISGRALTLDSASKFAIGANGNDANHTNGSISYFDVTHSAAWLTSHSNAVSAALFHDSVTGHTPQNALGDSVPSVKTRAFSAMLDKRESGARKYYYVGSEWLPMCSRVDSNGDSLQGYLSEAAAENLCTRSSDLNHADWTKTRSSIANDDETAPDKSATMDKLLEDGTAANTHWASIDFTAANTTAYTLSIFAKADERTQFSLTANFAGTGFNGAKFDLGVPSAATMNGTPTSTWIEDWGDGIYRCGWTFTTGGADAGATTLYAHLMSGGNQTYNGDGSSGLHLWGCQVEVGTGHGTSLVVTAGATATRLKCQERYVADDGNIGGVGSEKRGRLSFYFLFPDYDLPAAVSLATLSDGGAAADQIAVTVAAAGDAVTVTTAASGGDAGSVTVAADVVDNVRHRCVVSWIEDDLRLTVDGTTGTPDTAVDIPDDIDRLDIGMDRSAASQPGCLIGNIECYSCNR